ncbi:Ig-like domain-containing protein [Jatrophihabitans fulvus]
MLFVRRHRTAVALGVVAVLVAGLLVVLALQSDGYESRHVDLNDGGIWVTSDADGLFGRLNKPAGSLDLALNPPGGAQSSYQLDVRQAGAAVAAWDQASGKLLPVNVATGRADDAQAVPVSADEGVALAGGTMAVLDPAVGKVWAKRVDEAVGLGSLAELDPSAKAAFAFPKRDQQGTRGGAVAVGTDGVVYAASSAGDVATSAPTARGFARPDLTRVAGRLESVQITVVGDRPVVLDAAKGTVYLPGGRKTALPEDADARLQEPSAGGSDVIVASRTRLYSVPLAGGKPTVLFSGANGRPAAPTWLGDCVHAAWSGEPGVYARSCGGAGARRIELPNARVFEQPVFRVNRNAIVLNDLALGNVYDLDSRREVDNWSQIKPPPLVKPNNDDKKDQNTDAARDLPPKAVDDTWGARPGRTTVLHVLDNDSDPQGRILSITRLSAVSDPDARVAVAPDGQSVEVTLPTTDARDVRFKYTVDDGRNGTGQASVEVQVRTPSQNEPPRLRYGFQQRAFTVGAGGTLDLPALDDWRDFDGDPLVIPTAKIDTGSVTVAPSGRLNYVAPGTGASTAIAYDVTDGRSDAKVQRVPVTVLAPTSDRTSPPVAQPDIVRGQVGKPITVTPLANDLPGADPSNPSADLGIAGTIPSPAGTKVDTDLKSGTVTVVASRAGTFGLTYTASFGNAKFDRAPIRVDVAPPPSSAQPPTAVPDTGVLYGQTAATIDVLANDYDPAGGVLVVQRADAVSDDQLSVAVVSGRFLRVGARVPDLTTNPQVVRYTITNGLTAPVQGELTVTQVSAPDDDVPLAVDDYATVRSGDSALVPVLDNDIDPTGATLGLLDDVPGAPSSGALRVSDAAGRNGTPTRTGSAWVGDRQVRFAAPTVTSPTEVTVAYVATNPAGGRAAGTLHVTVTPPPSTRNPNQSPAAEPVDSRAVSGQTVRIRIPTTGVDPDGDTADVVAITSAPTLGRIVSIGANSITYEAFPTSSGTDRFGYEVSDAYGATSTSTVSVGVGQVAVPQPPVAVDDTITAAPGAKVRVDVLANDVVAPEDAVSIGDLGRLNTDVPTRVRRVAAGGPIEITARPGDGESVTVQYSISDGSADPSVATVTVRSRKGYLPPPTVQDVPATPAPDARTVTVDVLRTASDPQQLPLSVAKVYATGAVVRGGKVTVPVTSRVQNIVFAVENSEGAVAAAVIHVPAAGTGAPYVKPGQLIRVDRNGSRTIDLADHVVDPAGRPVRLTTADRLSAAPADGLRLTSSSPTSLTLTGTNGYVGPAAITFEVTDGATLDDPDGRLALLTLQVQVGEDTPVIRCPSAPLPVVGGGPDLRLDITTLCHVWLGDRRNLADLDYTATWTDRPDDVALAGSGGSVVTLRAGGSSKPGQQGQLRITADGTDAKPSSLRVVVRKLGPPSMSAVRVDGVRAGTTVTRDLTGSVSSPLRDPDIRVLGATRVSGQPARVTTSGSRVSITPARGSSGVMVFDVVGSDVPERNRTDRQFRGRITLVVLNVPDAPGAPQAGRTVLSESVVLSWPTPAANGAPIDGYRVSWPGGSQNCAASPCRITGLQNGQRYAFTVQAHNAVGYSKPSPRLSPPARPDKLPAAVAAVRTSNPQDGRITVSWRAVDNGASATRTYLVTWSGGGSRTVAGSARSVVAQGLDNHNVYTFTVVARNELGAGPPASARGQSAGAPATPGNVNVQYADAAGSDTRTVRVSWNASDANGPTPTTYTVTRDGTAICRATTQTSCTDTPRSGRTYRYSVVATNGAGKRSSAGSASFVVAGTPGQPANVNARATNNDGELTVTYTAPQPNGQQPRIECRTSTSGSCGTWTPPAAGTNDTRTIGGLPNGASVVVYLKACNEQQCGVEGASAPAGTNGPPNAPAVNCSRSGQTITWTWNQPAPVNGRPVTAYQLGGVSNDRNGRTSYSESFPRDGNARTLTVTSIDDRKEAGGQGSATCNAQDPPPPPDPATLTVLMGDHTVQSGCSSGCSYFKARIANGEPNTNYRIRFVGNPGGFTRSYGDADDGYQYLRTDGNGNGEKQYTGFWGAPDSGGTGTVTGSVLNGGIPDDTCSGDWKNTGGCQ